jgi:hypothetical protein
MVIQAGMTRFALEGWQGCGPALYRDRKPRTDLARPVPTLFYTEHWPRELE